MKIDGGVASLGVALLGVVGILVTMWSDVQTLKVTKVDIKEVHEMRLEFVRLITHNTEVIERLDRTLLKMEELNDKEKSSN